MSWGDKFYKIVWLEQAPGPERGYYYAWIETYMDYSNGPRKLKEEYYAEVRYLITGVVEFTISPMDSLQILYEKSPVEFNKAELRKCIKEYFKSINYKPLKK